METERCIIEQYLRVCHLVASLSYSVDIQLIQQTFLERIETEATNDAPLNRLYLDLYKNFEEILRPEDYGKMGETYESYAEAVFYLIAKDRNFKLGRTPGTGSEKGKRPDFEYILDGNSNKKLYFEVKSPRIFDKPDAHENSNKIRSQILADRALDCNIDLEEQRKAGKRISMSMMEVGYCPAEWGLQQRIDNTIRKITKNLKKGQMTYGATVLAVNVDRLPIFNSKYLDLLPVYIAVPSINYEGLSYESGMLWQVAFGRKGERIYIQPEFEGKTNLGEQQEEEGIFHTHPYIAGIVFFSCAWNELKVLSFQHKAWEEEALLNPTNLTEYEIEKVIRGLLML